MKQQIIWVDTDRKFNWTTYYVQTTVFTFYTLSSWEWESQPYFKKIKTFQDSMTLGIL